MNLKTSLIDLGLGVGVEKGVAAEAIAFIVTLWNKRQRGDAQGEFYAV